MSGSSHQHDALLALLGQLCDGTLDETGWIRLEQLLLADPEARTIYRQYLNLHVALKQYHVACRPPDVGPAGSSVLDFLGNGLRQTLDYCWRTVPFSILVAVGFPLLCAVILGIGVVGKPTRPAGPADVARLSRTMDCTWTEGSPAPLVGESLAAGRRLALARGLAEITMRDGTTLVLEGPATLDLQSAHRVGLSLGQVSAAVPKAATGFAVQTPDAVVVDLGTEFGVAVSPDGPSEVHVFAGEVELSVASEETSAGTSDLATGRRLGVGQAGRVNRTTASIDVFRAEAVPRRFTRQLPTSRQRRFQQGGGEAYAGAQDAYICNGRRGRGAGLFPDLKADEPNTTGRNFGHDARMFTSHKTGEDGFLPEQCRTLIAFEGIFGDGPGQTPPGAVILSAVLRLHTGVDVYSTTPANNTLHEALVAWDEDTVTWASFGSGGRPGVEYVAQPVAHVVPDRNDAFYELNVTSSVQRWSRGAANHGWILVSDGWDRAHFDSSDAPSAGNRPELIIEYQLHAETPAEKPAK